MREFSLNKKFFIASIALLLYSLFFAIFYPIMGNNTVVFTLIFSITVTWLCGLKFGFAYSLFNNLESHVILYFLNSGWQYFHNLGGFPGVFAFLITIILVGYFREIKKQLEFELNEKEKTQKKLIVTQEKLKSKTEEIIHFTRAVSHDLKNPVTGLEGLFSILHFKEYFDKFDDEMKDVLNSAGHSINYMKQLLNDLTEVAKLESKIKKLKFEKINLKSLVDEVLAGMKYQVNSKGIKIDYDNTDVDFIADRYGIVQIVANLAGNAIKYCSTVENPKLFIKSIVNTEKVIISFEDNGPGIPEDQATNIFEKFKRGSHTMNTEGTGLGLFLVKSMVEAHRGEIIVSTKEGQGAKFIISLPTNMVGL